MWKQYIWIYATIQLALVIAFSHVFYTKVTENRSILMALWKRETLLLAIKWSSFSGSTASHAGHSSCSYRHVFGLRSYNDFKFHARENSSTNKKLARSINSAYFVNRATRWIINNQASSPSRCSTWSSAGTWGAGAATNSTRNLASGPNWSS